MEILIDANMFLCIAAVAYTLFVYVVGIVVARERLSRAHIDGDALFENMLIVILSLFWVPFYVLCKILFVGVRRK